MATKNVFSVRCDLYTSAESRRRKAIDGPWKPTVEEAVVALAASLKKKGMDDLSLFNWFVVERVPEAVAPSKDSRGNHYRTLKVANLQSLLVAQGLNPLF